MKVLYETAGDAGFKNIARTYVGVTISPKALTVSGFTEASYCLSMMGGWEYDIQWYSNFLVEPCDQMKTLMGLVNSTKTAPDSYVRLKKTGNDVVTLDKCGKQLNNHPLYDALTGNYVASSVMGSFLQFPVKLSAQTRGFNSTKVASVTSSDLMAFSARNNKTFRVPADFKLNNQLYSVAKLTELKQKSWARGGVIKDSSIRIELPTFLEESYNFRGQNYQEHTTFTVDASNNKNLTNTEKRLERKRLGYFDV